MKIFYTAALAVASLLLQPALGQAADIKEVADTREAADTEDRAFQRFVDRVVAESAAEAEGGNGPAIELATPDPVRPKGSDR